MSAHVISVAGSIAAPRHRVFVTLADLDTHHALTDGRIELLELHGPPGARTGGRVRLRGPFGFSRSATTAVRGASYPHTLEGTAHAPRNTRARLRWRLSEGQEGTRVVVEIEIAEGWWADRLVLRAGGGWWLRRRMAAAIERLGRRLDEPTAAAAITRPTLLGQ
jgi:polyketide cyclase/dehydrase/lipid transport protein